MITFEQLASHPHFQKELAHWMFEEWGHFYPGATLELTNKWVKKTSRQSGLPLTMLALDGDELVGFAMVQRQELIREKGIMPWLGGLLVKEGYQGNGIGKQLNQWATTYIKSLGYGKMYLLAFDQTICEWYKSQGWTIKKIIEDCPLIIMENTFHTS